MSIAAKALSAITGPLFGVIDKAITDKDEAARLKHEIQTQLIDAENSALKAQMQVVLAEAAGESWLQRNWRPILMLTIVAIIGNNYLLAPYLSAMFGVGLYLDLPERLWDLMTLGVGGYVAGRTVDKGIKTWQQGKVEQSMVQSGLYREVDVKRNP